MRRNFLTRVVVAVAATPLATQALAKAPQPSAVTPTDAVVASEAFFGKHQGGITTPMQRSTYFMAFDLTKIISFATQAYTAPIVEAEKAIDDAGR